MSQVVKSTHSKLDCKNILVVTHKFSAIPLLCAGTCLLVWQNTHPVGREGIKQSRNLGGAVT